MKALAKCDVVLSGEVQSIGESPQVGLHRAGIVAKVVVKQCLKGGVAGVVEIHTGFGGGDCGYHFEEGKSYLIYANRSDDGRLNTGICLRTALLQNVGEEVLELEGRLPEPRDPAAPPGLSLAGKIDDAGYNGLIFTLENRLHDRIFFFSSEGTRIQIFKDGKWTDYAPNQGSAPRDELTMEQAEEQFFRWKETYLSLVSQRSANFMNRLSARRIFVRIPTTRFAWRLGFDYLTEAEVDAGQEISSAKSTVWSDAIVTTTLKAPPLTFSQAFRTSGN
ncbi:hypothetical protein [Haloferula sp. BvORR071]|uniref:hypothetical protein n=1 Tax=Haloferula sp. BvORR071 TaxID=1396141 RepID=UPI0006991CF8|nr:hypothetical protein [Haloferula sp. BvORR071]